MGFDFIKALNGHKTASDEAATEVAVVPKQAPATKEEAPVAEVKTAGQEKVAAFVDYVEARTEKIASLVKEERTEKHAQLFRNCVSACFHTKMAGYASEESDDPSTFMAMCYNMYKDIVGQERK